MNADRLSEADPPSAQKIPLSVLLPGLAGLIPFVVLSLSEVLALGLPPIISLLAFNTYGAVILSFVGAIWWGLAAAAGPRAEGLDVWLECCASLDWLVCHVGGA